MTPTLLTEHMTDAKRIENGLRGKYGKRMSNALINKAFLSALDREKLVWYLPHISFCVDWDKLMAQRNDGFNLIEYRLNDSELEAFDAWLNKQSENPTAVLISLATLGYKVSLTYVENSQAWCASITGKDEAKFNQKTTLTSWGDEPLEALYMGAFKVTEVFKGGKWQTRTQTRRG